jgi:hypothetical protein
VLRISYFIMPSIRYSYTKKAHSRSSVKTSTSSHATLIISPVAPPIRRLKNRPKGMVKPPMIVNNHIGYIWADKDDH